MAIVWKEYKALFIIGPYFFEETGALGSVTVTVTGQRYECLLRNHDIPALQQRGWVDRIIFMQEGASSAHCKSDEAAAEAAFQKC